MANASDVFAILQTDPASEDALATCKEEGHV
jgi:hypothetical protein